MARTLKQFERPKAKGGRKPTYPWDKWLNGQTWELVQNKDFTSKVIYMQKLIRRTAAAKDKAVSVFQTAADRLVITQRKSSHRAAG